MKRRRVLRCPGTAGVTVLGGCISSGQGEEEPTPTVDGRVAEISMFRFAMATPATTRTIHREIYSSGQEFEWTAPSGERVVLFRFEVKNTGSLTVTIPSFVDGTRQQPTLHGTDITISVDGDEATLPEPIVEQYQAPDDSGLYYAGTPLSPYPTHIRESPELQPGSSSGDGYPDW